VVVEAEQQATTASVTQTKTSTVSDNAKLSTSVKSKDPLTDTKDSLVPGEAAKDTASTKMEAELMDNSYGTEHSALCLDPATSGVSIDANYGGMDCQMVTLGDGPYLESMMSDLSINSDNGGVIVNNGDMVDVQLLPEGEFARVCLSLDTTGFVC